MSDRVPQSLVVHEQYLFGKLTELLPGVESVYVAVRRACSLNDVAVSDVGAKVSDL